MESVFFKTFGCRTNQFDTQLMMSKMKNYKISLDENQANIIIINSCTVTNGADKSVRSYINKINNQYPDTKIILAGCGSHSKGESFFQNKKVFGVIGHSEKENLSNLLDNKKSFYAIGNLEHIDSTILTNFIGKTRAFIKIQEGCDFNCSYCIIPSVRGTSRSHKESDILKQIEILTDNGFSEFILTGTNIASYGDKTNSSIAKILKKISIIRGVKRIRIGSIEPIQIDDEFIELLPESWMSRYLHIALQHTSDKMLEVMQRRNRFNTDLKLFNKISSYGYALGTDYIVGHPYETDKIWQEGINGVKELPLTHIHAFTYSKRDNTLSANMKNIVRGDVAKKRLKELTTLISLKNIDFIKRNSQNLLVLIENYKDGLYSGYDQYFNKNFIKSDEDIIGKWIEYSI